MNLKEKEIFDKQMKDIEQGMKVYKKSLRGLVYYDNEGELPPNEFWTDHENFWAKYNEKA